MPAAIHPHKISLWQAGLAELVGTCIFTTTALGATATSTIHGEYTQIAMMHGIGIYVLVTIFGPISGGHLNSAVSLTHLLNKRIDFKTFLVYVIWKFQKQTKSLRRKLYDSVKISKLCRLIFFVIFHTCTETFHMPTKRWFYSRFHSLPLMVRSNDLQLLRKT